MCRAKWGLVVIWFAGVLSGCVSREHDGRAASGVVLDASRGVVFAANDAGKLLEQCTRKTPWSVEGYWTPTASQVRHLEEVLPGVLERALKRSGVAADRLPELKRYYRQYGGIVIGSRRLIYVNGFDEGQVTKTVQWLAQHHDDEQQLRSFPKPYRDAQYWHGVATTVCDGGLGYFGVEYDPSSGTFENFHFNDSG